MHFPPDAAAHVKAALLVAPVAPERRGQLADFAPVPCQLLPYRSIVVASDNDPFCPVRLATACSRAWGRDLVKRVGAGHINVESEAESFSGVPEQRIKTCPIKAQSTAIARAMARICNAKRVRFGAVSGHGRKTRSLSGHGHWPLGWGLLQALHQASADAHPNAAHPYMHQPHIQTRTKSFEF